MIDLEQWNDMRQSAKELGSFCVNLLKWHLMKDEANQHLPIHDEVIDRLVKRSHLCRLYAPDKIQAELLEGIILNRKSGYVDLDPRLDLITRREYLWNVSWRVRGTIIVAIHESLMDDNLNNIFNYTSRPIVMSSINQIKKGHTPSAINHAIKLAGEGSVVFCFPANNGIQWMDIFVGEKALDVIFLAAVKNGTEQL